MRLLVIDNAEPVDADFNQPLFDFIANAVDYDVVNHTVIPSPMRILSDYAGIILTGVPVHYSFESIEDRLQYYQWLLTIELPILGICIGHEIIGMLYGADVICDLEAEQGLYATTIEEDDPLLTGIAPSFDSHMMHRASITLPESFKLLARTTGCGNIIMRHRQKAIYGLQHHPELSPDGLTMLKNFVEMARLAQQKQR